MTQAQSMQQQTYNPWYIAIAKLDGGRHYFHVAAWGSSYYKKFNEDIAPNVGIKIVAEEFNVPKVKHGALETLCARLNSGEKIDVKQALKHIVQTA